MQDFNNLSIAFRPEPSAVALGAGTSGYEKVVLRKQKTDRKPQKPSTTALVDVGNTSQRQHDAATRLRLLFDSIHYDDETDNEQLTSELLSLLQDYGDSLLDALEEILSASRIPAWKLGELLSWLGQLDHASSYQKRRYILASSLLDRRAAIRDGAISALAALDDLTVLPKLEIALTRETSPELKVSLKKVIEWLQRD